jgi:hypothetical protein
MRQPHLQYGNQLAFPPAVTIVTGKSVKIVPDRFMTRRRSVRVTPWCTVGFPTTSGRPKSYVTSFQSISQRSAFVKKGVTLHLGVIGALNPNSENCHKNEPVKRESERQLLASWRPKWWPEEADQADWLCRH